MNMVWTEISCEVPAAMVDLLADFLVELSGNGVSIENLSLDTFSLDTIEDSPLKTVKAYFAADNALEAHLDAVGAFLSANGPDFAGFVFKNPAVNAIDAEDWANNWKRYFKPVRIGSRLVIKPTWEEYSASPGDLILKLDPGMAFGTGGHPTTKMCLEALEQIFLAEGAFKGAAPAAPVTVLDVGTGSGVLSIGAAKLGAERIIAIDIDADAVVVAGENVALNECSDVVELSTTPLQELTGNFDLVLANILAEELVRLAAELAVKLAPAGFLVLSGILSEKENFVLDGFSPYGLKVIEIRREGEWSCISLCLEPR
ncbi:50S ribosomal protein L11 methyltransferase [Geotalea toluenoxydans]|uniref:50S ribosomal protein L11 methyltransferase n=1 Tax=Geotalea toluenoxydans TaxID=421624 RepID=UPI0006D01CEE|nr:50S ribosomal protein L11 methyltransferase [Geotalea toluenoxydans]